MKNKQFTALALAALVTLSLPALAELDMGGTIRDMATSADKADGRATMPDGAPTTPPTGLTTLGFEAVDADRSGYVSREEFEKQGLTDSLFTMIDKDHDGTLSRPEIDTHGPLIKEIK